jgi:hypothetical protein|tara:strand:+ start:1345 stop:1764 length:420 start_codon:yes stop_codon:yes gene_type:complete
MATLKTLAELERRRTDTYVTQSEVVSLLKEEGFTDVTERTLSYWRSEGLLPQLVRDGTQYLWRRDEIIDRVRTLCQSSQYKESPTRILFQYSIEGDVHNIARVDIRILGGEVKAVLYTTQGGTIVKTLKEEICHAIARS